MKPPGIELTDADRRLLRQAREDAGLTRDQLATALAKVISLNVQRRDMTSAQRAIVAGRCMDHTPISRDGRKQLASQFKVGENAVQQAGALLADAPDLADQVSACTLSPAAKPAADACDRQPPTPSPGNSIPATPQARKSHPVRPEGGNGFATIRGRENRPASR